MIGREHRDEEAGVEAWRRESGPLGSYVYTLNQNYFHNPAAWRDLETALDDFATGSEALGICTQVLIHTKLYYLHFLHPFRRHYEAVATAARERGLTAPYAP